MALNWPEPYAGETCGQLVAFHLGQRRVWLFDASYSDLTACLRRAEALELGWKLPFLVSSLSDPDRPGYYAYTMRDPRPLWAAWVQRYQLP